MTTEDLPVNLDDAPDLDVIAVEQFARTAAAWPVAIALGLEVGEARTALVTLGDYARAVREARAARLSGKIAVAMILERANEDRYASLPSVLQW